LTCNHLLRVRLGQVTYRKLYRQLYKVNGILDNSVILLCHTRVIIKDADVDVVAKGSTTINTTILNK